MRRSSQGWDCLPINVRSTESRSCQNCFVSMSKGVDRNSQNRPCTNTSGHIAKTQSLLTNIAKCGLIAQRYRSMVSMHGCTLKETFVSSISPLQGTQTWRNVFSHARTVPRRSVQKADWHIQVNFTYVIIGSHVSDHIAGGTSDREKTVWVQNSPPVKLE